MAVSGECALCKKESELKLSHIIPKFVYRALKKDSFTGRLRLSTEPNRAIQDGEKMYLLCGECEKNFNEFETIFSNKVYIPFKSDGFNNTLKYDGDWLCRFITSVSWRTLFLDIKGFEEEQNPNERIDEKRLQLLKNSEEIMRKYLLKERMNIDYIKNHIFFFDTVKESDGLPNPHTTIQGSVFGFSVGYDEENTFYVISNLSGIIIVTILKGHSQELWRNTFVKNEPGKIKVPQNVKSPVMSEIPRIQKKLENYKRDLSENQRKQIQDKITKDIDGFKSSGSYRRIMLDAKLKENQ